MIDAKTAESITKKYRQATRDDLNTPTMQKALAAIEDSIKWFSRIGERTALIEYDEMFTEYGSPVYCLEGLRDVICEYLKELGYKAYDYFFTRTAGRSGYFHGLKIEW